MTLPIPSGTYGIDTMHSQLGFSVTHIGISLIRGTFDHFSGSLTVGATLADTAVAITAGMASVNSGNALRDQHVHGAEFFDVAKHEQMTFRSTSISETGSGYSIAGDLTIKGITQPLALEVTYNGSCVFPMDQLTHYGFGAHGVISRSAFDMGYGTSMVSDDVELQLHAQFISPAES